MNARERMELERLHQEILTLYREADEETRTVLFACLSGDLDLKNSRQWLAAWNNVENWAV